MATACAPTGNNRKRAPALLVTSCASDGRTVGLTDRMPRTSPRLSPTVRPSGRPSEALCLIDQHDRNVVLDGVDEAARLADELFLRRAAVLKGPFALRADEDVEQVGR